MGRNKRNQKRHENLRQRIAQNPKLIGLSNVVHILHEEKFYRNNGKLACEPDIIFILGDGQKVLVEVKGWNTNKNKKDLIKQLKRNYEYFKKYYPNEDYFWVGVYQDKNYQIYEFLGI